MVRRDPGVGELLLIEDSDRTTEPADLFRAAVDISRGQRSRLLELRATIRLARLLERSGARDSTREM